MPNRLMTLMIAGFWLVMTTILVKRDLLPAVGFGDMDYRDVLIDHVIGQQTRWKVNVDGTRVGIITGMINRREEDGVAVLISRGVFDSPIFGQVFQGATGIRVSNEVQVSPLGSLQELSSDIFIDGIELKIHLAGRVEGDELVLKLTGVGVPLLGNEFRFPIDKQAMVAHSTAALDRITNLHLGKKWVTRAVNPLPSFGPGTPVIEVRNSVIALEPKEWNGKSIECYHLIHEHPTLTAHSWLRSADGVILIQQIPFGGFVLTLERDESLEDW